MNEQLFRARGYVCFYVDDRGDFVVGVDMVSLGGAELNGLVNYISSWVDDNTMVDEDDEEDDDDIDRELKKA